MLVSTEYWERLQLEPSLLDTEPSIQKLRQLQEAHLARIPFENLAQHGCVGGPAVLDVERTADKILRRKRGGFCFELNALFGTFLQQLDYSVNFVSAFVHAGEAFAENATHLIIIAKAFHSCDGTATTTTSSSSLPVPHYVDVGFAEPPLHPLDYTKFGVEQISPEGMRSKLVKQDDEVQLQWLVDGEWRPRLKWSFEQSQSSVELSALHNKLAIVQSPESNFSKKVVATRLTRTSKCTLAGSRLKVTGPPRFQGNGSQGPKETTQLASADEARQILVDRFGIPFSETEGLLLEKSNAASEEIWSHM